MKGIIKFGFQGQQEHEFTETEFFFRPEDVRSFFRKDDYIEMFVLGQGIINIVYEEEVYNKLKDRF
jgi:hypothetical protein